MKRKMGELVAVVTAFDFTLCLPQDDDKPMIDIMDQLSPVILESFANVAVSDTVSGWLLNYLVECGSEVFVVHVDCCSHIVLHMLHECEQTWINGATSSPTVQSHRSTMQKSYTVYFISNTYGIASTKGSGVM